ncbi:MAG: chitobiase/beta-hexosaminidase C-terminal domain-containing protein, partial [Candidatus Cloacimonetes bacterium]|nr:chitobiase/beta-hexosaminidase C-terminal domain-containing protein [Candidatus Cloacimonadota bacterium]
NGDDAVALITGETSNPTYIDIFGRIGERPSVGYWGTDPLVTKDKTLVRKLNITYGVTVNPESGFPTLATEWDSYPVNTFIYLGSHTFSPGQQPAAAPTFDPPAGIYSSPINVTISSITPGVTIRYTTDGSTPSETVGTIYTTPVYIDATTTLKAVAYSEDYALSPVSQAIYLFPVNVSTIAELRAGTPGTYYKYTGTGVLTFQQAFRHQKFIQDTTAGILIDDNNGVITTVYNLYDGISNIIGTVAEYGGMMQLTPIADSGPAVSTGNVIIPQEISLNELVSDFEAYESELVRVMNVSFDTADNVITFTNGTLYPMNNGLMNFRTTFYDVDYIGMPVPTGLWNIIGIPNSRVIEGNLFTARFWADFSSAGIVLPAPVVTILVEDNTIILSWEQISGATSYRIEAADDPYGTFTLVETTTNLNVSYPAFPRKFYRVIAIQ